MPLSETVLIISALLTVAMLAAGLFRHWPVPYTVILVVIGLVLGELSRGWEALAPLGAFKLSPELVFFIFLPALIFESGFNLDARQLIKDLAPVLVLAIPALLLSTAFIGVALWQSLGLKLEIALLFGALISATDPVAVIALFKELGAPSRLTLLVEGESLLNDASAIVVFGIVLAIAVEGPALTGAMALAAVVDFLWVFLGGALLGAVAGVLVSELLHRIHSGPTEILVMSIVMAYGSFILAEHYLHVSGVMAVASGAVTLAGFGITRFPHQATTAIGETWELIALVCNSLLFLLVGLSVNPWSLGSELGTIVLALLFVLAARAATVYSLVPLTTRLFSLPRVTTGERHIMWWGGLKGGLAIAIVLSVPESLPGRQLLLDTTLGVVLFTLLINAPTIRPLMSRLGLDRLTQDEEMELKQAMSNAQHRVEDTLYGLHTAQLLSSASHRRIGQSISSIFDSEAPKVAKAQLTRHVYLVALQTELEELRRLHEVGLISQYTFLDVRNTLQRDKEAHAEPAMGEPGQRFPPMSPFQRFETTVLRRFREKNWAAGLLSSYQSTRLGQRLQRDMAGILMCREVLEMLETREELDPQRRLAIADIYKERLAHRIQRIDRVREDFPIFYQRFETRLFMRVALMSALRGAEKERHRGELGEKGFGRVQTAIAVAVTSLPRVSEPLPTLEPEQLIELVPLLTGLPEEALRALAERAHPVTMLPGDVIIGEDEHGDAFYIITHGQVSVVRQDGESEARLATLREGDFFGEAALLGDHVRTATVRAAVTTTLLRLTRRDVLALAKSYPEVARRLREVDAARRH